MKATVMGVKQIEGTSKASGEPFTMVRIFIMVPVENVNSAKVKIQGYGFELAEMELSQDALKKFEGIKFPAQLELSTDQRLFAGEYKTFCTGIAAQVRAAA